MKLTSGTLAVLAAVIISISGIAYSFASKSGAAEKQTSDLSEGLENPSSRIGAPTVSVRSIAKEPEAFIEPFLLDGVVAGINEKEKIFGVIDTEEFATCNVLTCAEAIIPVKYEGKPPAPKTRVHITGKLVASDRGYLFDAEHVATVKE